jgi:hypothetical protein
VSSLLAATLCSPGFNFFTLEKNDVMFDIHANVASAIFDDPVALLRKSFEFPNT